MQTGTVERVWPDNLLTAISTAITTPCAPPASPLFHFEMTAEAAQKNFIILRRYNMSLAEAIAAQSDSPVGYGSEFRPTSVLAPIFRHHPNWERMCSILSHGSDWPLTPLAKETRAADLEEARNFGNHKGAEAQPDLLRTLNQKDIIHGYTLPLPLSKVHRIPGVIMAPMNIMQQNTIDEHGRIIDKDRLTHDQSYEWTQGLSVNSRVDKSTLLQCRFGHCLNRLINWTVAARKKFPGCPILAQKIDYKSAYKRCHLQADTAIQTCTQLPDDDLALIALRLTFGGSPGPYEWSAISETICDLSMAILQDDDWDPATLHAPNPELVPPPVLLPSDVPFGVGRDLVVDIPVNPKGIVDIFLDDTVSLTVALPGSDHATRLSRATLLAIHASARPQHPSEPIPREEMAALAKLLAEAGPEEQKIILGWLFDFRRMLVLLPDHKFIAWTQAIKTILSTGSSTYKELECNIGRLTHLGQVISPIYHFLSRLRELQQRAKSRRSIKLTAACREDLRLMLVFLEMARAGISMNLIAYRLPNNVYRNDACPFGLGGFSHRGHAWRFYLPAHLRFRASNNLLEHIASIISIWVDILAGRLHRDDCALSMTDSSTSAGWTRKTNFKEDCETPVEATVRIEVARQHVTRLMAHGIKDYSQWFPGRENDVADALSRDDDRSDSELTHVLNTFVPSQLPQHFEIVPLPNEIVSWLTSLLLRLPVKKQLQEVHTRSKLGRGGVGRNTGARSASAMTPSLTPSHGANASDSWAPSPWLCVTGDFRDSIMTPWLKAQSEVPSHMWRRPSGKTTAQTPQGMRTGSLAAFYQGSTVASATPTPTQSNRRRSPLDSSASSPSSCSPRSKGPCPN